MAAARITLLVVLEWFLQFLSNKTMHISMKQISITNTFVLMLFGVLRGYAYYLVFEEDTFGPCLCCE